MLGSDNTTMGAIKGKLAWNEQRHRVIASNVANVNTPQYRPNDIKLPDFHALVRAGMGGGENLPPLRTNDNHLGVGSNMGNTVFNSNTHDSWEVTPSGNEVVSEEQMVKLSENATDYQISITLYSRSLGILRSVLDRS